MTKKLYSVESRKTVYYVRDIIAESKDEAIKKVRESNYKGKREGESEIDVVSLFISELPEKES
jgi:hypothetical protein